MARNGSGTYSLPAGNPVVTGTTVSSTWANTTLTDIGTALTTSIASDGQTTPTANLPMGGFKLTGMGVPSARTDSATLGALQNSQGQLLTGTAGTNTITAAGSPAVTAYTSGQTFRFVPAGANTGATTLNIDSLGAKNIFYRGAALTGNEIPPLGMITVTYDGTQFNMTASNGAPSAATGFTNRFINGSWRFDQNREGASAYTASAGTVVAMDAWSGSATGAGSFTMQRVTDPDNASLFALKIACTVADAAIAAGDVYSILTAIEGYDAADLKAGTASASQITISFDMKFDVAGVYPIAIRNSAANRSYVGSVTQLVASTNESKTVTLTLDTAGTWLYTNGVGLYMNFGLAVGSTFQTAAGVWTAGNFLGVSTAMANFMSANTNVGYIKRIQCEKGGTTSAFQEISQQADLSRVQRYASKSYGQGVQLATVTSSGRQVSGQFSAGTGPVITQIKFPVEMRASPTVTGYSWASGLSGFWGDGAGADQPVIFGTGTAGCEAQMALGTISASAGHYYANARLT